MNPELQKAILDLLNSSKEFVVTQAPDAIQQFLYYNEIENIFILFISAAIFLCFIGVLTWVFLAHHDDDEFVTEIVPTISVIGLVITIIVIGCSAGEIFQIKYAPKGYLLQKAIGHNCR